MTAATTARIAIRALDATEAAARIGELADLIVDAVAHGASVNFMAGFTGDEGQTFWRGQLSGIASGERRLFVGDDGERIVGTAVLSFAPQPNAPHRAEVTKMLVHSSVRRQGLGRSLLATVEQAALAAGYTLLLLDTETDCPGDLLYRNCGWVEYGRVPDHAFKSNGRLAETTFFYKVLGPHAPHRFRDGR